MNTANGKSTTTSNPHLQQSRRYQQQIILKTNGVERTENKRIRLEGSTTQTGESLEG